MHSYEHPPPPSTTPLWVPQATGSANHSGAAETSAPCRRLSAPVCVLPARPAEVSTHAPMSFFRISGWTSTKKNPHLQNLGKRKKSSFGFLKYQRRKTRQSMTAACHIYPALSPDVATPHQQAQTTRMSLYAPARMCVVCTLVF